MNYGGDAVSFTIFAVFFLEAQFMDWEKKVEISYCPADHKGLQTPREVQRVGGGGRGKLNT